MAFYTREQAKEQIETILKEKDPIKTGVTLPIRPGETFKVYRIPIDYLAPNILNDRISWRIREYEAEIGRKLSNENEQDIEYIFKKLEDENTKQNANTEKDLANKGQQVDGIITKTGIIIDGNRRATLLRKLFKGDAAKYHKSVEEFRFFNAIVLTEDIDEREIMALETSIQIGEDSKVDYNRICLYIKVDNLLKAGYNEKQIANYMGKEPGEIADFRDRFKLMNSYLEFIGKKDHFSLLDGLEDQFIATEKVFKHLDNNTYATDGWDYTEADVADFKMVCYDYMRSKFEGKKYREVLVGRPNKTNGVFIKKSVWDDFKAHHEAIVEKANPQTESDWEKLGKKQFQKNLDDASEKLKETLKDKDITSIISLINLKLNSLEELLDNKEELSAADVDNLKNISKRVYQMIKDYK